MKFILDDTIKSSLNEIDSNEWKLVTQFPSIKEILIWGIVLGVVLTGITSSLISIFILMDNFDFQAYKKLYLFLLIIPLHELFHLIVIPNIKNSTLGYSWRKFIFFISTDEIFSKNRFLLVSLLPLIVLTVFPIITLFFLKSEFVAYFALYNLIGSGIDIISFSIILKLPNNPLLKFHGANLYAKYKND